MSLRDSWKETGSDFLKSGSDIGHVFKGDATLKETGTDIGHAFKGLGKSIFKSAKAGVDLVDEKTNKSAENASTEAGADNGAANSGAADESVANAKEVFDAEEAAPVEEGSAENQG